MISSNPFLKINRLKRSRKGRFFKLLIRTSISKPQNGLKILVNLGISIGRILKKLFPNGLRTLRKIMIKGLSLYKKALNPGLRMQKRHGILIGKL